MLRPCVREMRIRYTPAEYRRRQRKTARRSAERLDRIPVDGAYGAWREPKAIGWFEPIWAFLRRVFRREAK